MVPAIPMGCTTLGHGLDEDAQLLQAHVGSGPHANDADAQALRVCEAEGEKPWLAGILYPIPTPRYSFLSDISKLRSCPMIGKDPWFYPPPFCQWDHCLPFALSSDRQQGVCRWLGRGRLLCVQIRVCGWDGG